MNGLMQPGPTQYEAEQRRKKKGSQGLLGAVGTPMSFSPNPLVNMLGEGLLGAQYLTGEKPMDEGLSALAMMTGLLQGTKVAPIMRNAIKVYHGSPHKYDKPDSSKIGTGEGAQAYGHGLYWAESPATAKSYAKDAVAEVGGKQASYTYKNPLINTALARMERSIDLGLSADEAKLRALKDIAEHPLAKDGSMAKEAAEFVKGASLRRGNLYEASLRWPDAAREAADPLSAKHFLDWDKPLAAQPDQIKETFKKILSPKVYDQLLLSPASDAYDRAATRAFLQDGVQVPMTSNAEHFRQKLGSDLLKQHGIPGITYLDGMSRSAGEGTRNYVTFDDALVELLKRNGVGLLGK
jgi:hypothetical protein